MFSVFFRKKTMLIDKAIAIIKQDRLELKRENELKQLSNQKLAKNLLNKG